MELKCLCCENEFEGTISKDELGWHSACPDCGSSFDVDVPEGRIVVAFANPDYDAPEPYKSFEQDMPEENICSYYGFATPQEFINKWYEMVEDPDGMWYWVIDTEFVYANDEKGVALITSGACDPGDIEIFRDSWRICALEEDMDAFFKEVEVAPEHMTLTLEQRDKAKTLLQDLTYDDMSKREMALVVKYEVEQFKMKADKLFAEGWCPGFVGDIIQAWWDDFRMADVTENALLQYVEQKAKDVVHEKPASVCPQAVEAMMRFKEQAIMEPKGHDPSLVPPFVPKWEEIANRSRLIVSSEEAVILSREIVFEEKYENADYDSTTFYFKAPKELFNTLRLGYHPDAVAMEISVEFPSKHIEAAYADVCVSPTNADGSDYDWSDIDLPHDEIEALIDLANKSMSKDSLTVAALIEDAASRSDGANSKLSDRDIEKLWDNLEDVPVDKEECLDVDWNGWPKGTHREEIWHWFDEHHSKGVGWLMNEYEPGNDVEIGKG